MADEFSILFHHNLCHRILGLCLNFVHPQCFFLVFLSNLIKNNEPSLSCVAEYVVKEI